MGDKNNFYVMDDDYIEQKYVKAEEERQKLEEQQRKQREIDEANALIEAERQRKAADTERRRREEEAARAAALENAKKQREELDLLRKTREDNYQSRLGNIENELNAIQERKGGFIDDKLNLAKNQADEEARRKQELEGILEEKRKILEKEQNARVELEAFQSKSAAQKKALEVEEAQAELKQKELIQERRAIQDEMLKFLQDPAGFLEEEKRKQAIANAPPKPVSAPIPSYQQPQPVPSNYGQPQPYQPMQQPNVGFNAYNQPQTGYPQPGFGQPQTFGNAPAGYPPMSTGYVPEDLQNKPNPLVPFKDPTPAPVQNKSSQSNVEEQLRMVDDLLQNGIINKEEHAANRQEILKANGMTEPPKSQPTGSGNAEVDKQIAQLDQYLRDGVLQKSDYDDAKKRVLADAGLSGTGGQNSGGAAQVPTATGAGVTNVTVVVPQHVTSGQTITITYQGKNYNVTVPNGVSSGQPFQAAIPV